MATLADLYPEISVETPRCGRLQIERAMQATLRHFCFETHFWQHDIDPLTLLPFIAASPDTYLYEMTLPEDTEVIAIRNFIYDGKDLAMQSPSWLTDRLGNWRERTGEPWYYLMLSDRRVRFGPASDKVRPMAITGRVVLRPSRRAINFSDDLMEYDQGLIKGALSRLLLMGKKPWSDPGRAKICQMEYMEAVSQAKYQAMKEFSDGAEERSLRSWV